MQDKQVPAQGQPRGHDCTKAQLSPCCVCSHAACLQAAATLRAQNRACARTLPGSTVLPTLRAGSGLRAQALLSRRWTDMGPFQMLQ